MHLVENAGFGAERSVIVMATQASRSLEHHGAQGHAADSPRDTASKSLMHGKIRRTFSDEGLSGAAVLGRRISVFWEGTEEGDMWYSGTVVEFDHGKKEYLVEYDDGDRDWYDLMKIKYTLLSPHGEQTQPQQQQEKRQKDKGNKTKSDRVTFASLDLHGVNLLGHRLEIFWSDPDLEDAWYGGTIIEFRLSDGCHFVQFDDGDSDWYKLDDIKYRVPDDEVARIKAPPASKPQDGEVKDDSPGSSEVGHHEVHSHHTAHGHTHMYGNSQGDTQNDTLGSRNLLGSKSVGCVVDIYWEDDEEGGSGSQWYRGTLDRYDPDSQDAYHITYDDGDEAWYDMARIKHKVVKVPPPTNKPKFAKMQPAESAARSREWLEELKRRRAARKNGDLGYEVDGDLSVGGVVALRIVHEAMLRDRYVNMSEQERLDEYWDLQLKAFAGLKRGAKNMSDKDKAMRQKERVRMSQRLRKDLRLTSGSIVLPPLKISSGKTLVEQGSDLHDRFHELARAHGDLDAPNLPGQVPDDESTSGGHENDHIESQIKQLKHEAHTSALERSNDAPDIIEHKEDPAGEALEKELLSGAKIPPPPAPSVKASLDKLLIAMKTGELGKDEKEPEEYVKEFLDTVPEKEIVVGSISLRDVQLQERKIEMERLDTMRREVARYRRREEALLIQEEKARLRVLSEADTRQAKLDARHHRNIKALRRMERALRRRCVLLLF